jgi:hypothetical protein
VLLAARVGESSLLCMASRNLPSRSHEQIACCPEFHFLRSTATHAVSTSLLPRPGAVSRTSCTDSEWGRYVGPIDELWVQFWSLTRAHVLTPMTADRIRVQGQIDHYKCCRDY